MSSPVFEIFEYLHLFIEEMVKKSQCYFDHLSKRRSIREFSDEEIQRRYYTKESVGIAAGMLISAVHNAGLVSLTHPPSPMKFPNKILNRPQSENPFLILVTGKPAADYELPDIKEIPSGKFQLLCKRICL